MDTTRPQMYTTQKRVEQMLDEGVGFEEIEEFIEDRAHLPRDVKNALWLLAWAETSRSERRLVVRELIAAHATGV
jgi:acetyl-CoA carboxylase carboxyltransferase component